MPLYRRVIVSVALLGFGLPAANAAIPIDDIVQQATEEQLVETIEQNVEQNIVNEVENSTTQSIERSVTDSVERSVDTLVDSQTGAVAGAADRVVDNGLGNSLASNLQTTAKQAGDLVQAQLSRASELVASLAPVIPIKGRSGSTVFNDVAVENKWRAVENEWLLVLDKTDLAALKALDIKVLEQVDLDQLGFVLVRFRVDDSVNSYSQLQRLFPEAMPAGELDRNHIYNYWPQSGAVSLDFVSPQQSKQAQREAICNDRIEIGVIDTAIDYDHVGLNKAKIIQRRFLDPHINAAVAHGTAIAGVLVGKDRGVNGVVPNASLAVASVVYQRDAAAEKNTSNDGPTGSNTVSQGATALSLLRALDWLAGQGAGVINMSIAGPPNKLLERAIDTLAKRSVLIVAAVGNEGPAAPPAYPAAYPQVIGVTAVDASQRIYRWANRGAQVDFAARGVDVITLRAGGSVISESGTSMAAPIVSAHVACLKQGAKKTWGHDQVVDALGKISLDLGKAGRDNVFGLGLLE